MQHLAKAVEAILFTAGRPVTVKELAKSTETSEAEIRQALDDLIKHLEDSGVVLTQDRDSYQLVTNPSVAAEVVKFSQAQLREKLSEAAVETLAIVAYKQPVTRAEIEAIRGVNSQYTIKLLLQRGLIEKRAGGQGVHYHTTHEFLHHLGLTEVAQLPDFEKINQSFNQE